MVCLYWKADRGLKGVVIADFCGDAYLFSKSVLSFFIDLKFFILLLTVLYTHSYFLCQRDGRPDGGPA